MTTLQHESKSASVGGTGGDRVERSASPARVVAAIFKRDLIRYFSNPAGYVFITIFVFVSSLAAFWRQEFFTRNLANFDLLNEWIPYLLLLFIPAITMATWAEERRQGTDELLLTLPARDIEVVAGKYLACLGIYTVALAFMLSHLIILRMLGRFDLGVIFATYLGYWLTGAMMIAIGMTASMLSSNATIAFILGALFCAAPVFMHFVVVWSGDETRRLFEDFSVRSRLHDLGTGVIPLSSVCYFVAATVLMLYINVVLLGRRHWAGGEKTADHWTHSFLRIGSLAVALISLTAIVGGIGPRIDVTQEGLHTLSPESKSIVKKIPGDRPIYIQAYFSPEVPREYVSVKEDLINTLKEFAALAGKSVRLNLIETELYSNEARDAQKRFNIVPRRVMVVDDAKQATDEIILGVAFRSGAEEIVIPFFDRGLSVEYELARSIRVVSREARRKLGVLETDAKLLGGFDFRSMNQSPEWPLVTELKKQYNVSSVSPDSAFPGDLDVLLVAQPSSLTQKQIDSLTTYVKNGHPTVMFMDPFPATRYQLSPEIPRQNPGGMFGGGPPPEPKGDLTGLLRVLGIDWPTNQVVWNPYNPHPLMEFPREFVFITGNSGDSNTRPFNPKQSAVSGLQEVAMLFPGYFRPRGGSGPDFIPLVETNEDGGVVEWNDLISRNILGMSLNPDRAYVPSGRGYTLAARIKGTAADDEKDTDKAKDTKAEAKSSQAPKPEVRAILIGDLDMISDEMFELRRQGNEIFDFDNIAMVLNCVDVLAGDEAYVSLRKHRPKHRTLEELEKQTRVFVDASQKNVVKAEDEAKRQLALAQKRLDDKVAQVRASKDDQRTKEIMLDEMQRTENQRLTVEKAKIEDDKRKAILESKQEMERAIRAIQLRIRLAAIGLPPLPALLLGLVVLAIRLKREYIGVDPGRLV